MIVLFIIIGIIILIAIIAAIMNPPCKHNWIIIQSYKTNHSYGDIYRCSKCGNLYKKEINL